MLAEQNVKYFFIVLGAILIVGLAIYIVFFSFGLKVDWTNLKIQQTSILIVESQPTGAEVYLDGELVDKATPSQVRWVLPGEYHLEIKKEGYQTFNKIINFEAGLVTKISNVNLFYKTPEVQLIGSAEQVNMIDQSSGYYFADNQINYFSLAPNLDRKIYIHSDQIRSLITNPKFDSAIVNDRYVIDLLSGKQILDLKKLFPKLLDFKFLGNDYLLAQSKKALYSIDINNQKSTKLLKLEDIDRYFISDNLIYSLTSSDQPKLQAIDQYGNFSLLAQDTVEIIKKNVATSINLEEVELKKSNDLVYLEDRKNNVLLINQKKIEYLTTDVVKEINKSDDNSYLVVNQLNELYRLTEDNHKQIYIRTSSELSEPKDYFKNYLAYRINGDINIYSTSHLTGWRINGEFKIIKYWSTIDKDILALTKNNQLVRLKIN
jgi:hypothetical protein